MTVARKSEEVDHPVLEKRHNILGVHANLLQSPKSTDQLKVWETLGYKNQSNFACGFFRSLVDFYDKKSFSFYI